MSKTGQEIIRKNIRQASPDDPIYTSGFVIGGRRSMASSSDTQSPPRVPKTMDEMDREIKEWMETGIYEAAAHQMRGGPDPSTDTDEEEPEE